MHCTFEYRNSVGACHYAVCKECGYSVDCVKQLPLKRVCDASRNPAGTAGSHLKQLISFFSIFPSGCRCNKRALHMNRMGNDWCEQNIETIVEWLKEEAAARGLPFISTVGRMLVRKAISNARKEAERAKDTT